MSIVLRPAGWTEGAIMYAKGADTAMLPLLSSFDGMLQESRTGAKYEGGPDPQDTQYAESRFSRSTTSMRDGADRQNFPRVAPAGSVAYNTPHEASQNFAFSSEQAEPFKPCPAPESRVEADVELVEQHLKVFSLQGLRTMVLACKYMSQDETDAYQRLYNDACSSVYSREERLEQVAEQFERDLEYLGITGVRDKLQAYVPETLELMMEAGIRVWIATGDDVEYALHICHSCRLLTSHTKVFHAALATRGKRAKREGMLLYDMFREARILKRADEHICLVVTGPNLAAFLNHPDLQTCFLNMACCCDVVVAARVTPTQKADMVRLVKKRLTPQPITLAIGDGSNDVPMLQEASVGVAIRTERGTSVAGFADFAISEFRFLQRLLFVHGRLNFLRISKVILWTFFKSILLSFPVFLFQPSAFWSAVELFDPVLYMLANFLWTVLPAIVYSFSEQDLPEHLLPSIPVLYTLGRRRLYFNGFTFSFWTVEGIIYSLLTYYILQAAWMDSNAIPGGQTMGFFSFGAILLFGLIIQSNLRMLMETHLWTPTFILTTVGLCTLIYIPVLYVYSAIGWPSRGMLGVASEVFAWPLLYFVVLLWIGVGIMLQVLLAGVKSSLFHNIANNVKHWLAQRQAEHDKRRRVTGLPFGEPRLRLLPGGQDEYGPFCGTSSLLSAVKRLLWVCGFGACLPAPGPVHQLVDRRILAFLRDKFNPLRHSEVSTKLPPPRRFRVNENFVTYGGDKKEKDLGAQEKDGGGSHGRGGGAADDVSMDSNSSGMSFEGDKHRDRVKLVKVSHLINRFSLKFKDMQLEADYQIHQKKSFVKRLVPWYRVIFVFLGLYRIVAFLAEYFIDAYWGTEKRVTPWMCIPTVIVVLGLLGATLSTFGQFFMDHFSFVLSSVIFLMLAEHVTLYAAAKMDGILSSLLFPVFTFVILRISFLQAVMWNIFFVLAFTIRYIIGQSQSYLSLSDLYDHLPLFLGSIVFVGFVGYRLEYNQRKSFLLDYSVEASRRKQREILNTMLPPFVVDQMINAPLNEDGIPSTLEAEDRGTVSVVFCDVYEFQQVVASIEPTRLVEVLDSLFLCFDKSAEQFGCTKIETVFETYLAAAGLQPGKGSESDTSQTDAGDALDMALAMLEVAAQIRYEVTRDLSNAVGTNDEEQAHAAARMSSSVMTRQKTATLRTVLSSRPQRIRVKIGINSGRVISGVVGAKKPQYALFGDTVNTASRMKTTGQPDYIHISESTYDLVKDDTTLFYEARKTPVKGKGDMNTFLLVRVMGSSYPNFGEDERSLSGPLGSKDGALNPFGQGSASLGGERIPTVWPGAANVGPTSNEAIIPSAASFSRERQHTQEFPGSVAQSIPSTPRLTPGLTSRSSLSESISPPEGSSPRTPSIHSLERSLSRGQRSYSTMSSSEAGAISMTPQQLTRAYARQESVSRVLAFARDGLQTAVRESSELKRQEIARQVHAQILREQLHQGSSSVWSSQEDMSVGSNCLSTNVASLPQFRYAASHTADIRNSSRIGRSISSSTRQSPRQTVTKRAVSESRALEMRNSRTDITEPSLTTQDSSGQRSLGMWRAANDLFAHIGTEAHAKISVLLKVLGNSGKEEEHAADIGIDDEDNFEARDARIGASRESLLLMKFKDKNLEARYRTHFYNNKSNINTIEQAIIIFLVAFAVQTLVRLCLPWNYTEVVDGVKYTIKVSSRLYWGVRATYTCVAFLLWILFHYRNRGEVASRLEIRWMVFLLNILFISAACVFALSNSWSTETTTRQSATSFSSGTAASVLSPGVALETSALGTDMLTYIGGISSVRMPSNVAQQSPVAFLTGKSPRSGLTYKENCPTGVCQTSSPTEEAPLIWRRLGAESGSTEPSSVTVTVEVPGQRGASFWLVADSVELFFYVVILHHNTGLLFQNCILFDILLLTTCLTFILTAAVSTSNTIGMVVNFPCYVFFNLVSAYWKEYIDRLTFYVNEHAKTTEGRATQLLNDMLPKQVLEEFQQDKLRLAYTHDRMTFLFADICGFTSWAKNVDACEVVTMLQKLFAKFDRDSTKYKLYKLCTIGDAYVAVSEPVTEDNEDYDPVEGTGLVLTMAQSMITNIQEVRERLNIPSLNMRIGLHYGTCVGGVIGSGRLRYDLWGMDVLTGNMMESNGQPGKVNVSAILRDFLLKHFPGKFQFRFNKSVCVINKTVDSYIIHPAGEATDEDAIAQPDGAVLPPQGVAAPVPRRDDSSRQDIRGRVSRRGSIIGLHRALGRRCSVRGGFESSAPTESPRVSGPSVSRPASRTSSRPSLVPQEEAVDEGFNRQQRDVEGVATGGAGGAPENVALQTLKKASSAGHSSGVGMQPISEEGAALTPSPDYNSESSPEIY
ncbi:adenylate and guanylate cyclase catalytic domain-containing protein, putative [Eimeria necatrix]|uniref:guanylate cyclase n=1 Tax=Eimeria necatrix TaxID=51315 RepID=U6MNM5_9EIME|nr:adenylate and guanylate cyclase catalytic domain-containing protein, putative [Eimeria necatrix]CDJ64673.1 adenylate and guanylate cyclase catalytic domain-containing protein, putative [Eimeria necatrix]